MNRQNTLNYENHDSSAVFINHQKVYTLVDNISNDFNNINRDFEAINNVITALLNNPSTKGKWQEILTDIKKKCLNKIEISRTSSKSLENKLCNAISDYINKIVKSQANIVENINNLNKN